MNKEIQTQVDDLVAKLKADGLELDHYHEISILNALTVNYLDAQNAYVRNNLKSVAGVNNEQE